MYGLSVILFVLCATISVENYPIKEYNCPKFARNLCPECPSYENHDVFQCTFDYNCGDKHKCCHDCRYGYKVCTQIGWIKHHEYLNDKYCPKITSCVTPLKSDLTYYCSSDAVCPYGSKCCRNSCYAHKVCVTPVDIRGNEIIPPPTTLRFLRPSLLKESSSFGNGFNNDDDLKSSTFASVNNDEVSKRPAESTDSGDGYSDGDDDDSSDDGDYGSGSGGGLLVLSSSHSGITSDAKENVLHTTHGPVGFSSSGDRTSDDDGNDDDYNPSESITFSSSGDDEPCEYDEKGSGSRDDSNVVKQQIFSDDDGTDYDDYEWGSGDSNEAAIHAQSSSPRHTIASDYTTASNSRDFGTITTAKENVLLTTQGDVGFRNSGDGTSDDDDDGSDTGDNGSGSGDKVRIETNFPSVSHTTRSIEYDSSGDDEPYEYEESGSGSGDRIVVEQQIFSPARVSASGGLVTTKQPSFSEGSTSSDFIFSDENSFKLAARDYDYGFAQGRITRQGYFESSNHQQRAITAYSRYRKLKEGL